MEMSKNAQVKGVLKENDDVRYEMMLRNYWADTEYTQYGYGINKYHTVKTNIVSPKTSGMTLAEYTWGKHDEYSDGIVHKYLEPSLDNPVMYSVEPYKNDIHKWVGEYIDTFSEEENLSILSKIAKEKFVELSTLNSYLNEYRSLDKKYISSDLVNVYGSNPEINETTGFFNVYEPKNGEYDPQSGRIADIPEAEEVRIIRYYYGILNNNGKYYLDQVLNNAIKYTYNKGFTNTLYSLRDYQYIDEFSIDALRTNVEHSIGSVTQVGNRYSHDTLVKVGDNIVEQVYSEGDTINNSNSLTAEDDNFTNYSVISAPKDSLLNKTRELFNTHQLSTMVGRFHTSSADFLNPDFDKPEFIDSAKRSKYGNSHGRNLLKKKPEDINGYDDPYCRVWTYHHQYNTLGKMIRPFKDVSWEHSIEETQAMNKGFRPTPKNDNSDSKVLVNGGKYLAENTVLGNNGFVNIAPKGKSGKDVPIKKCMFSIENLAWKDVPKNVAYNYISKEQVGPNGGRIMWFPPYDIDFQETVNVDWDQNAFIGRGERVYTYKNTDRRGTLSFTLLIDHPNVVNYLNKESNTDTTEDDILRFFAGCQRLEIDTTPYDEEIENRGGEGEIEESPGEESGEIKFYVYFPNNYSGNMHYVSKQDLYNKGCSDPDWYLYLLCGIGTKYNSLMFVPAMRGYECTDNSISYDGQGQGDNIDDVIFAKCQPGAATAWKDPSDKTNYPKYYTDSLEVPKYYYRVDYDLAQQLVNKRSGGASRDDSDTNYKDLESYRLNAIVDEEVSVGANYSFGEFMSALIAAKKMANRDEIMKEITVEDSFDESIFSGSTNAFLDDVNVVDSVDYSKIIRNVIIKGTTNSGATVQKINELAALMGEGFKVSEITIEGSATQQDKKNESILAERRSYAIASLLQSYFPKGEETKYSIGTVDAPELTDKTSINTKEAKAQRYAVVTIKYNTPVIKKESESNDEEESSDEHIKEILKEKSNGISETYSVEDLNLILNFICIDEDVQSMYMAEQVGLRMTDDIGKFDIDNRLLPLLRINDKLKSSELSPKKSIMEIPYNPEELFLNYYSEPCPAGYSYVTVHDAMQSLVTTWDSEEAVALRGVLENLLTQKDILTDALLVEESKTDKDMSRIKSLNRQLKEVEREYGKKKKQYDNLFVDSENPLTKDLNTLLSTPYVLYGEEITAIWDLWVSTEFETEDESGSTVDDESNEFKETMEGEENKDNEDSDTTSEDEKLQEQAVNAIVEKESVRYETEAEYFSALEKNDPLIFKSIKKKFAYFNPAFHSISPEGFNARLNFLHQCTRQGHTIEASDGNYALAAGNLAFGRMPVCVLSLGDFIKSRIIIDNISINYSNSGSLQWDLNPEGIGVQPMYAKVSMGIVILGGQSLDGPISRLQNAVSFNYYANTGVYDDRADRIELSEPTVIPMERNVDGINKEMTNDFTTTKETYTHMFTPYPRWEKKPESTE